MTTEPTLEQWRERTLVAEALLEDRTQEAEGLKAKLDQAGIEAKAKAKEGTRTGRFARSDEPRWGGHLEAYQQQAISAVEKELLRRMTTPPKFISDEEFLKEYAPKTRFKVDVYENHDDGALRILVVLQGSTPQGFMIPRNKYLNLLDQPGGVINVANHAGKAIAEKLYLNSRDTSELCQRISDAVGAMRKRR